MIVDLIVGAVLIISAIIAFLRGFIREVLTIIGVVGGVVAAYVWGPVLRPFIDGWLGVPGEGEEPKALFDLVPYGVVSDVLSYGLIFLVVVILLSLLSHLMSQSVKTLGLGAIDRTCGVIFGLVRGALLLGLLYLPVHLLVDAETKVRWFESSKTHFYLEQTASWMAGFLPEGSREKMEEEADAMGKKMDAREKLKAMDVLRGEEENYEAPENQEVLEEDEGYNNEFRQKMDELFQQEVPAGEE